MACYVEKIRIACKNLITFVAALWGFFYFWAYYGIIYVSAWIELGAARIMIINPCKPYLTASAPRLTHCGGGK
jgi:hypothetical protein